MLKLKAGKHHGTAFEQKKLQSVKSSLGGSCQLCGQFLRL